MITCPWCGTNYASFQSNCQKCGGPLPIPAEQRPTGLTANAAPTEVPMPPPAPRPISDRYAWQLLMTDAWAIAAFVFLILGVSFTLIGAIMTIFIITAFVGIPFLLAGLLFLGGGAAIGNGRYQQAQKKVQVLRTGTAISGKIVEVTRNYNVRVMRRNPLVIHYQFQVNGQTYTGQVSTLNVLTAAYQPGQPVCVLYLPEAPAWNVLYPHP